jgi:hypothetical protein
MRAKRITVRFKVAITTPKSGSVAPVTTAAIMPRWKSGICIYSMKLNVSYLQPGAV